MGQPLHGSLARNADKTESFLQRRSADSDCLRCFVLYAGPGLPSVLICAECPEEQIPQEPDRSPQCLWRSQRVAAGKGLDPALRSSGARDPEG